MWRSRNAPKETLHSGEQQWKAFVSLLHTKVQREAFAVAQPGKACGVWPVISQRVPMWIGSCHRAKNYQNEARKGERGWKRGQAEEFSPTRA